MRLVVGTFFVGALFGLICVAFVVGASPARAGTGLISGIPMFALIVVYTPAIFFLSRYGAGITRLEQGRGTAALEEALTSQKSYCKYVAVLTTVLLPLGAVAGYVIGRLARHRAPVRRPRAPQARTV